MNPNPVAPSGVRIEAGVPQVEHNPRLTPTLARGDTSSFGVYQKVRQYPAVAAVEQRRQKTLASLEYDLEPPRVDADEPNLRSRRAAAKRLHRYYQTVWRSWSRPHPTEDRPTFTSWVREAVRTARTFGFYLGEIVAERASDGSWLPRLPKYISPSAVIAWQVDEYGSLRGVWLRNETTSNYRNADGIPATLTVRGGTDIYLPYEKFILISVDRCGPAFEGISPLRPVVNTVDGAWAVDLIERSAQEKHGSGELYFLVEGGVKIEEPSEALLKSYIERRAKGPSQVAGAVLPPGVRPEIASPSATMPDFTPTQFKASWDIQQALGGEDRAMARPSADGSHAARRQASEDAKAEHADDVSQLVVEPLVRLLVRMAYYSEIVAPDLLMPPVVNVSSPLEATPDAQVARLGDAKSKGLLTWAPEDEDDLRRVLRIRPRSEAEIAAEPPPSPTDPSEAGEPTDPSEEVEPPAPTDGEDAPPAT